MVELEIQHLELRYANLRVMDPGRVSRLTGSLAKDGQRSPVLVVAGTVLVDGYHRVAALRRLGQDVLSAVELPVAEADALVMVWRLETARRKSALEEGWLLQELTGAHGRRASELALELRRPRSWVSQRLGLVQVLPEPVQEAVRSAKVPAQAAMKSLIPMARADAKGCARMVAALPEPVTTRQVERLYTAWRSADATGRERIVAQPSLLLKAEEALSSVPPDDEERLARDLEGVASLCRRARRLVVDGVFARANRRLPERAWEQAAEAFRSLEEEVRRARS